MSSVAAPRWARRRARLHGSDDLGRRRRRPVRDTIGPCALRESLMSLVQRCSGRGLRPGGAAAGAVAPGRQARERAAPARRGGAASGNSRRRERSGNGGRGASGGTPESRGTAGAAGRPARPVPPARRAAAGVAERPGPPARGGRGGTDRERGHGRAGRDDRGRRQRRRHRTAGATGTGGLGRRGAAGQQVHRRRSVRLPARRREDRRHPRSADRLRRERIVHAGRDLRAGERRDRRARVHGGAGGVERRRDGRFVGRQGVVVHVHVGDHAGRLLRAGRRSRRAVVPVPDRRPGVPQRPQAGGADALLPARRAEQGRGARGRGLDRRGQLHGRAAGSALPPLQRQEQRRHRARPARRLVRRGRSQQVHQLDGRLRRDAAARLRREPDHLDRRHRHPRIGQRHPRRARRGEVGARLPGPHAEHATARC